MNSEMSTIAAVIAAGDSLDATSQDPLLLAMSQPRIAALVLPQRLTTARGAATRSVLLQAWGIALRELGDYPGAARVLRRSVREGDASGDRERAADARASWATTLHLRGRSQEAIKVLEEALALARGGQTRARIDVRLGGVLIEVGSFADAVAVSRRCIPVLRRSDDAVWLARAVGNRAFAHLQAGDVTRAEKGLSQAASILESAGQLQEAALRWHNMANLAARRGALPQALAAYGEVEARYLATGAVPSELVSDRAQALLDAGMVSEARAGVERYLRSARAQPDLHLANVSLLAAEASLADGDPTAARQHARRARRSFAHAGSDHWSRAARLVELRARWASGRRGRVLARQADELAVEMSQWRTPEESNARLFALRTALAVGDADTAKRHMEQLVRRARTAPPLQRSHAELGRALLAESRGEHGQLFRAAERGLTLLDEHRASLGATELRAHATRHGAELAGLAVEHAATHGPARDLLRWTERWRASVLSLPAARSEAEEDRELAADLTALRRLVAEQREAAVAATRTGAPQRERRELEERIRQRSLTRPGRRRTGPAVRLDIPAMLDALGERTLVSVVGVHNRFEVVVARRGRVRRVSAGTLPGVRETTEHARFALRTVAAGGAAAPYMLDALHADLEALERLTLGGAVRMLGDDPVVVVPPARLHALPWDALPALRHRAVSVAPSVSSWLRAHEITPPRRRRVTLVGAPRLEHATAEVAALGRLHGSSATVLTGEDARADAVLHGLDGAWLGHIAAHGTFRGDNPLLSALELADGPLTVYDLERLRRAPYRLVLSACESAVGSPTGADELLGLTSALLATGTAGVLASVVPVNDAATARLSVRVHERLVHGDDLAEALRAASAVAVEPVDVGTAYAFLALGAA